jgi:Ni/Fe-hydrogenase subunit HybB-like protein
MKLRGDLVHPVLRTLRAISIGLLGAILALCDVYLGLAEVGRPCPIDYNLAGLFLITALTAGIPLLLVAAIGAVAALKLPNPLRLGLLALSVLVIAALPIVNALPHADPQQQPALCPAIDL